MKRFETKADLLIAYTRSLTKRLDLSQESAVVYVAGRLECHLAEAFTEWRIQGFGYCREKLALEDMPCVAEYIQ